MKGGEAGEGGGDLRTVAFFPDRRQNPYLDQLARGLEPHGYQVVFPGRRWPVVPMLSALPTQGLPDVVHLHWQHPFVHGSTPFRTAVKVTSLLLDLLGLRLLGVPVVWTVHNVVDHERTAPGLERAVGSAAARLANRVVVHCSAAVDRVARAYRLRDERRGRIGVVPHPDYRGAYPPLPDGRSARADLGLGLDRYVYLHLGAIRPYKRLRFLATQFATASPPEATLLVAGRPGDRELADGLVELAASTEHLRVDARRIPHEEVPTYFAAADVFVYGADRIMMSGSVMLALTFGLPVVAPPAGCLPEVVPESDAFWYEPDDAVSLREALRSVRQRPAVRSRRPGRGLDGCHDRESVGRRLASVYDRVVGR